MDSLVLTSIPVLFWRKCVLLKVQHDTPVRLEASIPKFGVYAVYVRDVEIWTHFITLPVGCHHSVMCFNGQTSSSLISVAGGKLLSMART